jgi:hypothetical protein
MTGRRPSDFCGIAAKVLIPPPQQVLSILLYQLLYTVDFGSAESHVDCHETLHQVWLVIHSGDDYTPIRVSD